MARRSHALRFEAWLWPPVKETGPSTSSVPESYHFRLAATDRTASGHEGCKKPEGTCAVPQMHVAITPSNTRRKASLSRKRLSRTWKNTGVRHLPSVRYGRWDRVMKAARGA